MCFFVPSVRPCMHHNYSVTSGRHTCRDCVWPIILFAGLYTTRRGGRVLLVIRFNVTFLALRPYWEQMCTSFLNDAESLTTYGCALWCSPIVYIRAYSLNTIIAFYFVTECSDVAVFFGGVCMSQHIRSLLALTRIGLSDLLCM